MDAFIVSTRFGFLAREQVAELDQARSDLAELRRLAERHGVAHQATAPYRGRKPAPSGYGEVIVICRVDQAIAPDRVGDYPADVVRELDVAAIDVEVRALDRRMQSALEEPPWQGQTDSWDAREASRRLAEVALATDTTLRETSASRATARIAAPRRVSARQSASRRRGDRAGPEDGSSSSSRAAAGSRELVVRSTALQARCEASAAYDGRTHADELLRVAYVLAKTGWSRTEAARLLRRVGWGQRDVELVLRRLPSRACACRCGRRFAPRRRDQEYALPTCRKRAQRTRAPETTRHLNQGERR